MRLVCVAFLLAVVAGCNTDSVETGSPKTAPSTSVANWKAYNSTDHAFVVEFPSTPEPWETEFESADYGHTDVYHVSTEFDGAMYGVNFNDYPRDLTDIEVASELKNAYTLPDTGAEILATTEIEMADHPAVEVISKTGPLYMVGRFFISDARRLYSLQVGSVRDLRVDRKLVDRFFQSFKLVASTEAKSDGTTK